MELVIDVREKSLIEQLAANNVPYVTKQLDLGDIQLHSGDEVVYVIERKTTADLVASLRDGRYREQKNRLLENFKPDQVMYLIEGYWDQLPGVQEEAAIHHTIIRDRVCVYHVPDVAETARLLEMFLKDWERYRDAPRVEYQVRGNLHSKKKDNMTVERTYMTMLTCVTGVSLAVAKAIHAVYPGFKQLIEAKNEDIYAIKVNDRRVSKKAIERLLQVVR